MNGPLRRAPHPISCMAASDALLGVSSHWHGTARRGCHRLPVRAGPWNKSELKASAWLTDAAMLGWNEEVQWRGEGLRAQLQGAAAALRPAAHGAGDSWKNFILQTQGIAGNALLQPLTNPCLDTKLYSIDFFKLPGVLALGKDLTGKKKVCPVVSKQVHTGSDPLHARNFSSDKTKASNLNLFFTPKIHLAPLYALLLSKFMGKQFFQPPFPCVFSHLGQCRHVFFTIPLQS